MRKRGDKETNAEANENKYEDEGKKEERKR